MKDKTLNLFFRKERGAALAETAVVMPILILLIAGMFELGMYILLNNKLVRMAGVVGDVVTRQNISRANLTALMQNAFVIAKPFEFSTYGKMVVSQVRNSANSTDTSKMLISWQQAINGGVSLIGLPGARPVKLPDDITVINNQSMVITEVFYEYSPLIFTKFFNPQSLYKVAVFVPRIDTMNTLLGE